MLLIGHEHIMKLDESIMDIMLIIVIAFASYVLLFSDKSFKAHTCAYCLFP